MSSSTCPEFRRVTEASTKRHTKAECPNPRVFKGACRVCNKEGHPASECPDKPPEVCRNCQKEGSWSLPKSKTQKQAHNKQGIRPWSAPRTVSSIRPRSKRRARTKPGRHLWLLIRSVILKTYARYGENGAVKKDPAHKGQAIKVYVKAVPGTTWAELEHSFRHQKFNTHIIAYVSLDVRSLEALD